MIEGFNELECIDQRGVVLMRKWSALEWFMKTNNLSFNEALKDYRKRGIDTSLILEGYKTQLEVATLVNEYFENKLTIVEGESIERDLLDSAKLIIALGGDNYFQHVSHFITDQPTLFINSDPERSNGALAGLESIDIKRLLPEISEGNYYIENWSRLEATIRKPDEVIRLPSYAMSEIFFGDNEPDNMTKYLMEIKGQRGRYNDSGLIVATGAGTTGWFDSAIRYVLPDGFYLSPLEKRAAFVSREFFPKKTANEAVRFGEFGLNDKLVIQYLGYTSGRVSIDCKVRYKEVEMGDMVEIGLADQDLRVVKISQT